MSAYSNDYGNTGATHRMFFDLDSINWKKWKSVRIINEALDTDPFNGEVMTDA